MSPSFEAYGTIHAVDNEIFNVSSNATFSLVSDDPNDHGQTTWYVHHNQLVIPDDKGYPIEFTNNNGEFAYNYFRIGIGGAAVMSWTSEPDKNIRFHHNYVHGILQSYPSAVIWLPGVEGLDFYNNTIELDGAEASLVRLTDPTNSRNIRIVNNIVARTTGASRSAEVLLRLAPGAELSEVSIQNNLFFDYPESKIVRDASDYQPANLTVSGNLMGNPQWVSSGARPAYYQLQPQSPAMNAGLDVGLPFNGSAPELGAWEAP